MKLTWPSDSSSPRITFALLLLAGLAFQLIHIPILWGKVNTPEAYSARFAVVLGAHVVITVGWTAAFVFRRRLHIWIQRLPGVIRTVMIVASGVILLVIWQMSIEPTTIQYLAGNWLLIVALPLFFLPDQAALSTRWFGMILGGIMLVLFVPIFISNLSERPFNPDEAIWADFSSTLFYNDGLYRRLMLDKPVLINPGKNWFPALYGWALTHIAFDVRTGRIFNVLGNLLNLAVLAYVTRRFFGKTAAWISLMVGFLGWAFFAAFDFRPDHFLPAAQGFVFLAALAARQNEGTRRGYAWHFACGLAATLALQIHTAALGFVIGIGLFYVAEVAVIWVRQRQFPRHLLPGLIAFGAGALIGSVIYIVFNIYGAGGFQAYLSTLIDTRYRSERSLQYLSNLPATQVILIWAAFAYLMWRRSAHDKLYLSLTACMIVGIFLVDTQGYAIPYRGMLIAPVGVLFVSGFGAQITPTHLSRRFLWLTGCLLLVLVGQTTASVDWSYVDATVRTGQFPSSIIDTITDAIAARIDNDTEVIVGTHELIWGLEGRPNYVGMAAESNPLKDEEWDEGAALWQQVQPDLIIDISNRLPLAPGLVEYMEAEAFVVCDQFAVANYTITFYRQTCPTTTNPD